MLRVPVMRPLQPGTHGVQSTHVWPAQQSEIEGNHVAG